WLYWYQKATHPDQGGKRLLPAFFDRDPHRREPIWALQARRFCRRKHFPTNPAACRYRRAFLKKFRHRGACKNRAAWEACWDPMCYDLSHYNHSGEWYPDCGRHSPGKWIDGEWNA